MILYFVETLMRTWTFLLSLPLFVLACGDKTEEVDPKSIDDDGDGFTENDGDCNDADPNIKPFSDEICDFFDNDCCIFVSMRN